MAASFASEGHLPVVSLSAGEDDWEESELDPGILLAHHVLPPHPSTLSEIQTANNRIKRFIMTSSKMCPKQSSNELVIWAAQMICISRRYEDSWSAMP